MIVIKKCVVCKKDFEAYDKPKASRIKTRSIRRSNSKTCSPTCSKLVDYKSSKLIGEEHEKN